MVFALLGILILQVRQFSQALELNEQTFDNRVEGVLTEVIDRIQEAELPTSSVRYSRQLELQPQPFDSSYRARSGFNNPFLYPEGSINLGLQRVKIRDSLSIVTEQVAFLNMNPSFGGGQFSSIIQLDSVNPLNSPLNLSLGTDPRLTPLLPGETTALDDFQRGLEDQLDSLSLDSLIQVVLDERQLPKEFRFGISSSGETEEANLATEKAYAAKLFPGLPGEEKGTLRLYFPKRNLYLLESIWLQAGLVLLLSGIIVAAFWISVRTIFQQKRLSEMKNDFINNMTHELKTPIATISLAADAIDNPRIRSSDERMSRYTRIIREENKRMQRQVERVLLAARFDRGEIRLKKEPTDLHQIIQKAATNLELQIRERGGELKLDLQASESVLNVDKDHFSNLIYNLLDNANKYSPDEPQVTVSTRQKGNSIVIEVQDQGLGISPADQAEIFTRFFRVSTGNLHDIKGFGLGLSYVKEITEAHGGKVEVHSTLGQGSTFIVSLPILPSGEEL